MLQKVLLFFIFLDLDYANFYTKNTIHQFSENFVILFYYITTTGT